MATMIRACWIRRGKYECRSGFVEYAIRIAEGMSVSSLFLRLKSAGSSILTNADVCNEI